MADPRRDFVETVLRALHGAEFGFTPHPVFSKTHAAFLRTVEGPRAPAVRKLLDDAARLPREAAQLDPADVTRQVHRIHARHAALGYAWVPRWPLVLQELIDEVRFAWGERASNVETTQPRGLLDVALGTLGGPALSQGVTLWDQLAHKSASAHFDRIAFLNVSYFDFEPDTSLVEGTPEDVRFTCTCGRELTRALDHAGLVEACDCGAEIEVPAPPLGKILAILRDRENAARGIVRCKVCGAVVQTAKGPIQAAGYCTKLCAVKAGAKIEGAGAEPVRRGGPVTCPKCSRKSRAGSTACAYCGEALP